MRNEIRLDYDERINLVMMMDLLVIFKIVESITKKPVPEEQLFYLDLRSDYISYDDAWYGIECFLHLSGIGEIIFEHECCVIHMNSLQELSNNFNKYSIEKQNEINEKIEDFLNKMNSAEDVWSTQFNIELDETDFALKGAAEFRICYWHPVCEILSEMHKWANEMEGLIKK
ncbi:TPA: hypothetical protein NJY08_004841 [Salmonella enterica subsp. enterica serovar Typhi str. AG3]|nr:hypothetical protein [Salmonella enterica subsp. enterica serovar Typhi str. AG3]